MRELIIFPEELKSILNKVFLLDVRTEEEYKIVKINSSVLIPIHRLEDSINELPKDKEIVVYCHHGIRSAKAVEILRSKGFVNVKSLFGGINKWSEIDKSVKKY